MGDQYRPYEPPSEPDPEEPRADQPANEPGGQTGAPYDPYAPLPPSEPYPDPGPQPDPFGFHPLDEDDLVALGFVPAHPGAIAAAMLGGASVALAVLNLFCCFTGLISLVIGPIAIVRGLRARREIDAQPGRFGNRRMATSAITTGTLGTVLGALTTILYLSYAGLAFNTGYVY